MHPKSLSLSIGHHLSWLSAHPVLASEGISWGLLFHWCLTLLFSWGAWNLTLQSTTNYSDSPQWFQAPGVILHILKWIHLQVRYSLRSFINRWGSRYTEKSVLCAIPMLLVSVIMIKCGNPGSILYIEVWADVSCMRLLQRKISGLYLADKAFEDGHDGHSEAVIAFGASWLGED